MAPSPRSPVLLLGAGSGEATCGILYLASFLRRNHIEAYVRLWDADETPEQMESTLSGLMQRVRPRVVGISLKWFHHVHRAIAMAKVLRRIDPSVQIVVGGNTASYFWRELHALECFDYVVLGDGEVPLLAICEGHPSPPNCVTRSARGSPTRLPLQYIQGASNTDDIHYSHFDELFLSEIDRHSFSGWVAPGKGCGENCLYCGGARGNQKAGFGRAKPFLRAEENVRRDHREIAAHTWQMRYDFAGSTAEFLGSTWAGVDLSHHCCTYFLWGVARVELITALSQTFERVFMVLDIGCFSESQRLGQMRRGLLKPCATNSELMRLIEACQKLPNLDVEISGIGGLPFASRQTLAEEVSLVKQVIGQDCVIGYQRLESQPGALVTQHPERFAMRSEARTFEEFLRYFEQREPEDVSVPMLRYLDDALERAVQEGSDAVDALAWAHRDRKKAVPITEGTRLRNAAPSRREYSLTSWLGSHRVPEAVREERVTVVRSADGTSISCVPSVSTRRFADPALIQGKDAEILLATLRAFESSREIGRAARDLASKLKLSREEVFDVVAHLVEGRFLQPSV